MKLKAIALMALLGALALLAVADVDHNGVDHSSDTVKDAPHTATDVEPAVQDVSDRLSDASSADAPIDDNTATDTSDDGSTQESVVGDDGHEIDPIDAKYNEAVSMLNEGKESAALSLLEEISEKHSHAKLLLAATKFYGNSTRISPDIDVAFSDIDALAETGMPAAQFLAGVMYALGLGTSASQAKALVLYTFGALGGDARAQMALGYRYSSGLNVKESCELALSYYQMAAEQVEQDVQHTGGQVVERKRLTIGKQKSMISSDLLQFYKYNADRGDVASQAMVGQLYFQGQGAEQNFDQARHYFEQAAHQGHGDAMAFLGDMYATGNGVEANNDTALDWMSKSAEKKSAAGLNGLGTFYLHGQGIKKDEKKAFQLFSKAASMGNPDAQLNLGTLYYNGIGTKRDFRKAIHFFSLSAQQGHVLGMFNLGLMHATGTGTPRNCKIAQGLLKNVAERGAWSRDLMDAFDAYEDGDNHRALMRYFALAEMGYEVAQHNVAFLLDQGLGGDEFKRDDEGTLKRALYNWKRSASQGHAGSRVRLGDYLYYGHGIERDVEAAADEYRAAAEANNAQAMFNLGVMHQFGQGLPQDLHLAKRYLDMAADASTDAYVPASIARTVLFGQFGLDFVRGWVRDFLSRQPSSTPQESHKTSKPATNAPFDMASFVKGYERMIAGVLVVLGLLALLARQLQQHRLREAIQERQRALQRLQQQAAESQTEPQQPQGPQDQGTGDGQEQQQASVGDGDDSEASGAVRPSQEGLRQRRAGTDREGGDSADE